MKKNALSLFFVFFLCTSLPFAHQEKETSVDDFFASIQQSISQRNIQDYLASYAEHLQEGENSRILTLFETFEVEDVLFRVAHKQTTGPDAFRIHVQALFQNSYAVKIETWRVELKRDQGSWIIQDLLCFRIMLDNDWTMTVTRDNQRLGFHINGNDVKRC